MSKRDKRRKRKEKKRLAELRQKEGVEKAKLREAQRRFELLHGKKVGHNNTKLGFTQDDSGAPPTIT